MTVPQVYELADCAHGAELLQQCDVVFNVPAISLASSDSYSDFIYNPEIAKIDTGYFNLVVFTQSCDIAQDKTETALVAPAFFLKKTEYLSSKDRRNKIRTGKEPGLMILHKLSDGGIDLALLPPGAEDDHLFVDCRNAFGLPLLYLQEFALGQGKWLRMRSPYREQVSQAFGAFFISRVAVPTPVPHFG